MNNITVVLDGDMVVIERVSDSEPLVRMSKETALWLAGVIERDVSRVGRDEWFAARRHGYKAGVDECVDVMSGAIARLGALEMKP